MSAIVLRADARNLPLPDESVDLICTSPPYFGLRSYTDGGEHYAGQIGSEPTPAAYVAALLDCTREWVRVLKPSGSLFVNLGDKYSLNNRGSGYAREGKDHMALSDRPQMKRVLPWPEKCLMGLPWRYALGCIDDLGLILRAEIIWAKPNGLPESVTDRVRRAHEQVFHFTRQPRYYSAVDEVRESYSPVTLYDKRWKRATEMHNPHRNDGGMAAMDEPNPLGKLPGSVWSIASQPLTVPARLGVDHFAAFPVELPRRIIAGWSPPGICCACGEGRRPVSDGQRVNGKHGAVTGAAWGSRKTDTATGHRNEFQTIRQLTGYACACPDTTAPTRPAIILDPFAGTGTTLLVADALGRHGIGVDRSADYCRLARWRTTDPGERAKAFGVPKPPPVMDGQDALFAM